jgi:hypothetical protein
VSGVHVGLHLEDEAREWRGQRALGVFTVGGGTRRRGQLGDRLQQHPHPEVPRRRAEQHRRLFAGREELEQAERLEAGAVALVDEDQQRHAALARHLQQAGGLALDPARGVEQDDGAVGGAHHPQRVLGEVVVAGRVEQGHLQAAVGELQRAPVEQQLLGGGRLAGVGVGDDREGAPARGLRLDVPHTRRGGGRRGHRSIAAFRRVHSRLP